MRHLVINDSLNIEVAIFSHNLWAEYRFERCELSYLRPSFLNAIMNQTLKKKPLSWIRLPQILFSLDWFLLFLTAFSYGWWTAQRWYISARKNVRIISVLGRFSNIRKYLTSWRKLFGMILTHTLRLDKAFSTMAVGNCRVPLNA